MSFLVFNLFIFTTTLLLLSASSDVIYDSAGTELLRGNPYYILPLLRRSGGGLTLSRSTKDACPLNVTQESFEVNNGGPFTFSPIVQDEEIIPVAYPISISAYVVNPCHGSNIWKVTTSTAAVAKNDEDEPLTTNKAKKKKDDDDNKKKKKKDDDDDDDDDDEKKDDDDKGVVPVQIVTTGGEFNTPESCFQIVEGDIMEGLQSYQIQHCPFKCGSPGTDHTCFNVGVIRDADGINGYIGRTDAIFPVVFKSYDGTFSQPTSISPISSFVSTFSKWGNEVE
ncbi:hypothetical protein Lser_V15G36420 [Lactuca serriola]